MGDMVVSEDQMERTSPEDIFVHEVGLIRARPVANHFRCHSFYFNHAGELVQGITYRQELLLLCPYVLLLQHY